MVCGRLPFGDDTKVKTLLKTDLVYTKPISAGEEENVLYLHAFLLTHLYAGYFCGVLNFLTVPQKTILNLTSFCCYMKRGIHLLSSDSRNTCSMYMIVHRCAGRMYSVHNLISTLDYCRQNACLV